MLLVATPELEYAQLPGRLSADPLAGRDDHGVSVRLVRIAPGPRTLHLHPDTVEVIHVLDGRGRHRQGDEVRPVGPGDLTVVPVGVPHCTTADPGGELTLLCFFPSPELNTVDTDTVESR